MLGRLAAAGVIASWSAAQMCTHDQFIDGKHVKLCASEDAGYASVQPGTGHQAEAAQSKKYKVDPQSEDASL